MAQLELSQSSIAALEGIIQPLRDDIRGLGETLNAEGKQTTKGSGKSKKDKQKADKGFFKSLAASATEFGNQLSLALPGGARLFGLGKFLSAINRQKTPMGKFAVGLGQMTVAVFAVTEGLRAMGRQLGGMTGAEAGKFALAAWTGMDHVLRLRMKKSSLN